MAHSDTTPSPEWAFGPSEQEAKSMTRPELRAARARVRVEMLKAMGQQPLRIINGIDE